MLFEGAIPLRSAVFAVTAEPEVAYRTIAFEDNGFVLPREAEPRDSAIPFDLCARTKRIITVADRASLVPIAATDSRTF